MSRFKKAVRTQRKLRMTLFGPSGSGKTMTALEIASALGKKILVLDTEYGSASLYADRFAFDTCEVTNHDLRNYVDLFHSAAQEGYDVIVVDSFTHAWQGAGGELEMADTAAKKYQGNTFAGWRDVRPHERKLLDAILGYPGHVITTMRSKTVYEVEKDERTGKSNPKKIGLAPIQKEGYDFEFDIVGEISIDHVLVVTKTRFLSLDGLAIEKPGADFAAKIAAELETGESAPAPVDKPNPPLTPRVRPFEEFIAAAANHGGTTVDFLVDDVMASLIEDAVMDDGLRTPAEKKAVVAEAYESDHKRIVKLITDLSKHYHEKQAPPAGGPIYGNLPKMGKAMFPWIKAMERKFGDGLLFYLDGWARDQGFPFKKEEWSDEQIQAATVEAIVQIDHVRKNAA